MTGFVITGTDTGIGKTVVSAMLTLVLEGVYFKPIQAGLDGETDTNFVRRLTRMGVERFVDEAYRLNTPASPHVAAEIDDILIDPATLTLDNAKAHARGRPLIVEGAGGALVPVTRHVLYADVFATWDLPVIVCARTTLGTINHSLMTFEALRHRGLSIHGIIFVGDEVSDSERTICEMGNVKRLGRLPIMPKVDASSLDHAFAAHFREEDFQL